MDRRPSLVLSARLSATGKKGEGILTAFRPPRGSMILPLEKREPLALATAVGGVAAADPTVLLDAGWGENCRYDAGPFREAVLRVRPGAEVLLFDADAVLRFLWHYRDRHDPMALGHARERSLFPSGVVAGPMPHYRGSGRREKRRRAVDEIRVMMVTTGICLGIRAPIPPLLPDPSGWGTKRLAAALDACAGLYAGMLHRFQAPVAILTDTEDGAGLSLMDRGSRERGGFSRTHGV